MSLTLKIKVECCLTEARTHPLPRIAKNAKPSFSAATNPPGIAFLGTKCFVPARSGQKKHFSFVTTLLFSAGETCKIFSVTMFRSLCLGHCVSVTVQGHLHAFSNHRELHGSALHCRAGTCLSRAGGGHYCACPPGRYGPTCGSTDPCAARPCQHQGRCIATHDPEGKEPAFRCMCSRGEPQRGEGRWVTDVGWAKV